MELIDVITSKENLNRAYKKVVANKGAGGVDGMKVEELGAYIKENKDEIVQSIRNRTYMPKPVRRVYIPKDNGKMRPQEEDVAGFILNQSGQDIKNCYVTGCIYGSKNVYGFIKEYREWTKIDNCYVNAIINAGANACGFIGNAVNSTISNCHALGIISTKDAASGFIGTITSSSIENCYEAFWKIDSNEWYPFYQNNNNPNYIQLTSNYYLTDYLSSATGGSLVDYADKAKGLSYHQLAV